MIYYSELIKSNSQADELRKIAVSAGMGSALGALATGAAGAGMGYLTAPPEERTRRAILGGMIGAGTGAVGGLAATQAGRRWATQLGQRQLHGMTGYLPGRGVLGQKGPALTPKQRTDLMKQMGWQLPSEQEAAKQFREGMITKRLDPTKGVGKFLLGRRTAQAQAERRLAEEGLTSIPGLIKGYAGKTPSKLSPLEVAKLNVAAPGLAMGVALPVMSTAEAAKEYKRTGDPRALAANIASNVPLALAGGIPIAPNILLGTGLGEGAAALTGKLVGPRT